MAGDDLLQALLVANDRSLPLILDEDLLEQWRRSPQRLSWILSQLAKAQRISRCQQLLQLVRRHLEVNSVHFNCVLSACARNGDWPSAFALLSQMDQLEVASDMISFSLSVQACDSWALALLLLRWAEGRQMQLDTIAMNTLLGRCAKDGRWDAALELVQRMRQREVCQDTITYNICISACGKASRWIEAVQLLQEDMRGQSLAADGISYNAAISACADGQNWFQILKLLEEMRQSSVQKDGITYAAAISGMDHWQLALALFEQMQRESIQRDHVSYNAAIAACGWREAVALLSEHHKPDAASFGACISACEKSGEWQAAIFLLACMSAALVPMTAVTVAAAISACEKCVQWTMALQIFAEAATTMQLDVVSYNAAIAACEKGSCWEAALTFMRRLRLSLFFLGFFALQESMAAVDLDQEACGEEEVEAVEMAEAEALKTELLQVKVSSSATFEEDQLSFLQSDQASVVIDDMAEFQTMLVQTDLELTPTADAVV